jgi:probable HAF family extracellular repeat protein
MKRSIVPAAAIAVGLLLVPVGSPSGSSWTGTDLGPGSANRINDHGVVTGQVPELRPGQGPEDAFVWDRGVKTLVGTLGGRSTSIAAINDRGQVTGWSELAGGERRAFIWDDGVMTNLGTLGGNESRATGINRFGQVIGVSTTAQHENRAFIWDAGAMTNLGTLGESPTSITPTAINRAGQVVGVSMSAPNHTRAFVWHDGVMSELQAPSGFVDAIAEGINDRGEIIGEARPEGDHTWNAFHAFVWKRDQIVDLGAHSSALAINDHGQVMVRTFPDLRTTLTILWDRGESIGLGSFGSNQSVHGMALNNRGAIVGLATVPQQGVHAFVWDNGVLTDLGGQGFAEDINDRNEIAATIDGRAVVYRR